MDYLEESKKWVFRLYTREEACRLLRIKIPEFYKLRNAGLLKPMHRRSGYDGGTTFYTDRQIFEAIIYLHPDIAKINSDHIERQITEVPDNAVFKERRKKKKRKAQNNDAGKNRRNERNIARKIRADTLKWERDRSCYTIRDESGSILGEQDICDTQQD